MFWDKKEEKKLPDLPPLNPNLALKPLIPLPEISEEKEDDNGERHTLPSFPDSPMSKGFSQAAIKEAVDTAKPEEKPQKLEFPEITEEAKFKTIEMEEWKPEFTQSQPISQTQSFLPLPPKQPEFQIQESFPVRTRMPQRNSDIFVKIDKFNAAKKSLEAVKLSIEEIDEMLKKIRETKLREDQELTAWEKEINAVKARIQAVTENIFEKLE